MRVFLALLFAMTLLLEWPLLTRSRTRSGLLLLYLAPQALVVAVPIALTLAIAWASRRAPRSRQSIAGTIAAGAICSALSFVIFAWLVPPANQAYRVSMAHEAGMASPPFPGPPEMTIGELRQEMKRWTALHARWRELEYLYYFHWAFGFASLSLALLMTALRRRSVRRRFMLIGVMAIFVGYYSLMFFGREYALRGAFQVAIGAWLPNAITLLTAAAISMLGTRHQVTE